MGFITANTSLNSSLEKAGIIPDVINQAVNPSTLLDIVYSNGQNVALGNHISPQEASQQPTVSFVADAETAYYTLVMVQNKTDPDAPSVQDKKFGPWRHWVVINISGSDVVNSLKRTENQHTPYIGPGPGENTGTHRYTFLLYKQLKKQSFSPMEHEKRENRRLFNINQFVTENQLELVSANFFCCPT